MVSSGAVDQVWLVPVFEHAFEGIHQKSLAPFSLRMAWCQAMAEELGASVAVSDVESRLPAPSYSVDTLDWLARAHPEHRFHLVVGADILGQTANWKSWDKIVDEYAPIIVGREGYAHEESLSPGAPTFPAVSSTEVRARLKNGESIDGLVTPAVALALSKDNPWRK